MAVEVTQAHLDVIPVEVEEQLRKNSEEGKSYLNFPQRFFESKFVKARIEEFDSGEEGLTTCKVSFYGYMNENREAIPASEGYEEGRLWKLKTGKIRVESLAQFMSDSDYQHLIDEGWNWVNAGDDWKTKSQHSVGILPVDGENCSAVQFIPAPGISNGRDGTEERPIWVMRSPIFEEIKVFGGGQDAQKGVDDSRGNTVEFGKAQSEPQSPPKQSPLANRSRRGRKTRKTVRPPEQSEDDIPS